VIDILFEQEAGLEGAKAEVVVELKW